MDASIATEPHRAAPATERRQRNVGRIEEIQGVVIEAVFPDDLPEINHAITVAPPAADGRGGGRRDQRRRRARSVLVCEVQQHLGDDRVRAVAMDTTDGLARGAEVDRHRRRRSRCRSGEATLGRIFNLLGEPIDLGEQLPDGHAAPADPPGRRRSVEDLTPTTEMFETGIKVIDLLAPYAKGGKVGPVRRRRRRQDRADPGADPQPRQGARRPVGVLRRRRALARGQRPVAGDEGVGRARQDDARVRPDERAARRAHARGAVGPDDGRVLPRPGPGRAAVHRQHLPLRAGRLRGLGAARADALAGRLPADAGDRDGPAAGAHHLDHEAARSPRCRRSTCRPTTSPTRRRRRCSRTSTRPRRSRGRSPRRASTRRSTRSTRPRRSSRPTSSARTTSAWPTRSRRSCSATRSCRTSSRSSASTSSPTRTSSPCSARARSSASSRSRSSSPKQFTGTPGAYVPIAETIRGFKEIIEGKHDEVPESAFFLKGTIDEVVEARRRA